MWIGSKFLGRLDGYFLVVHSPRSICDVRSKIASIHNSLPSFRSCSRQPRQTVQYIIQFQQKFARLTCHCWELARSRNIRGIQVVQCTARVGCFLLSSRTTRSGEIFSVSDCLVSIDHLTLVHELPAMSKGGHSNSQLFSRSSLDRKILKRKPPRQFPTPECTRTSESHQAMVSLTLKLCPGCSTSSSSRRPNSGLLWPANFHTRPISSSNKQTCLPLNKIFYQWTPPIRRGSRSP